MSETAPLDVDLAAPGGSPFLPRVIPLLRLHLLAEAHRLGATPEVAAAAAQAVGELHSADPVTPRAFLTALDDVAEVLRRRSSDDD